MAQSLSSMPVDMSDRPLEYIIFPIMADADGSYVEVSTSTRIIDSFKIGTLGEGSLRIHLKFIHKETLVDDDYLVSENDNYPVNTYECPCFAPLEHLSNGDGVLKNSLRSKLKLENDYDAHWISTSIVQSAMESPDWSTALSKGHNYVKIAVELLANRYFVMRPSIQLPMEDVVPHMVPATEESIKTMLKPRRVQDSEQIDCVICLEQLSEDHEAVSMPCSHLFHGVCIQGWLNTSHCCPICRFQMPTASTQ